MSAPDAFLKACPSRALLARIAEKWTLLVLVALAPGPTRFGALRRRVEGVSQKMLTQTLRGLERDALITRTLYDEMPLRVEYELTGRGRALLPLAAALKGWAEDNFDPPPATPPGRPPTGTASDHAAARPAPGTGGRTRSDGD